jgi:hypothetical protein
MAKNAVVSKKWRDATVGVCVAAGVVAGGHALGTLNNAHNQNGRVAFDAATLDQKAVMVSKGYWALTGGAALECVNPDTKEKLYLQTQPSSPKALAELVKENHWCRFTYTN